VFDPALDIRVAVERAAYQLARCEQADAGAVRDRDAVVGNEDLSPENVVVKRGEPDPGLFLAPDNCAALLNVGRPLLVRKDLPIE
jgi:hypothetical protein